MNKEQSHAKNKNIFKRVGLWLVKNRGIIGDVLLGAANIYCLGGEYKRESIRNRLYTRPQIQSISSERKIEHKDRTLHADTITSTTQIIPIDFKLSGKRFTATDLGSKMLCSGRKINQMIIDKGLAKRHPHGGLVLTESGKKLGEETFKTTRYGYDFSNIEWDESVLRILFSETELNAAEERRARHDLA